MNSLYGQRIRKDIENEYVVKKESWLRNNNDEFVKEHDQLPNRFLCCEISSGTSDLLYSRC